MSYLLNTATGFTDDMIDGFVDAHADMVRRVPGGVVRSGGTPAGQVAVVIGGGSGHYPAFAGLVGVGLAHGAAMGNVFASPSAQQIHSVAKAAESGGGVLFSYGNYAGDVLNFDQAQDRLVAEGIPARTVTVTDDVSSAPASDRAMRRGVAGDLMVFRAAAWAAEQGRTLDEVWAVADLANRRTRTLGVAFSGCTLPGADQPLFTVEPGTMAVGMGIHGEPGIELRPLGTADEIAHLLVESVLAERPDDLVAESARVAVMLNGLGSVKSEELYVLYKGVATRLRAAGLTVINPEVGEFATSFEMAGVSFTLMWLDDADLERSWCAPVATPGYRRGPVSAPVAGAIAHAIGPAEDEIAPATPESRGYARQIVVALQHVRDSVDEQVEELGRLDAIAGDGDHGIGMQRGATAAAASAEAAVAAGAGAGSALAAAADAWADRAGGTSGALWGRCLRAAADRIGDEKPVDATLLVEAVRAGVDAVRSAGGAQPGDKTMLDAMLPFARRLETEVASSSTAAAAWAASCAEAGDAAAATAELVPRRGRARTHTTKSLGTPDPGAVSFVTVVMAASEALTPTARTGS